MKESKETPWEELSLSERADRNELYKTINFGIHKGKRIKDIPEDYIVWYTNNFNDNGFNNTLRSVGKRIIKRHEEERKKAIQIPIEFQDSRYQFGNQRTVFYLQESLMERALNGFYRLTDIEAYSVSFRVPNHMLLIDGQIPEFRFDLFLQMSETGYTLILIHHQKKEMYVSKKQEYKP